MTMLAFQGLICDGLKLKWEEGRMTSLSVRLNPQERDRLAKAGGSEAWGGLDLPLKAIKACLLGRKEVRPDTRFTVEQLEDGRVRLALIYRGQPIGVRVYEREIIERAMRLAGWGCQLGELLIDALDTGCEDFDEALYVVMNDDSRPADGGHDAGREAWRKVWYAEAPVAPPPELPKTSVGEMEAPTVTDHAPEPPPLEAEPSDAAAHVAQEEVADAAQAPEEPPPTLSEPAIVAPVLAVGLVKAVARANIPRGPLTQKQLRTYLDSVKSGMPLPATMSEAARVQFLAYAEGLESSGA